MRLPADRERTSWFGSIPGQSGVARTWDRVIAAGRGAST